MRAQLKSTVRETWMIWSQCFNVEWNISLLNYVKIINNNRTFYKMPKSPPVLVTEFRTSLVVELAVCET